MFGRVRSFSSVSGVRSVRSELPLHSLAQVITFFASRSVELVPGGVVPAAAVGGDGGFFLPILAIACGHVLGLVHLGLRGGKQW